MRKKNLPIYAVPSQVKTRLCNRCDRPFESLGNYNRRCPRCEHVVRSIDLPVVRHAGGVREPAE